MFWEFFGCGFSIDRLMTKIINVYIIGIDIKQKQACTLKDDPLSCKGYHLQDLDVRLKK